MSGPFQILPARDADLPDVVALMREYASWLGIDLSFQGFASEVAALPGDYAPPSGALLIARTEGRAAGMVALRRFDHEQCEMKRLFVRPEARGTGLGSLLIERVITEARGRGYRRILLDTLPVMHGAQRLYERAGFADVAPYYVSPVAGTRYLARDLD